jgi:diguanylate cyclase (GGDEF) domain
VAKKTYQFVLLTFSLLYTYAIVIQNNLIGDIFSPILMLIITGNVYIGFVKQQTDKVNRWAGWFMTLAVFSWFLCDFLWGVHTLILRTDPEKSFITVYGYCFTSFFIFLTMLFTGYRNLKKMNKIQAMLDTTIVTLCIFVLLWLFVFEQKEERINKLLSDPIAMITILLDIIIYAWINVWVFSTRTLKPLLYQEILAVGGLIFAITDLVYWYMYFYTTYEPNSWIDGFYMIAFATTAIAAVAKMKAKPKNILERTRNKPCCKLGAEIFFLIIPIVVFIYKREQIQYFTLLVVSMLIYYVLINYTQKSIFQEKLLELEKKNVAELEKKVEERTKEIIRILNTDYVTGLFNRRYFETLLAETMNSIRTEEMVSVIYIDQNNSRAIKNLLGKNIAENLLRIIAESFSQIVSPYKGILAAYGEDTCAIMIKDRNADAIASKIAEQILSRCNDLFLIDNHAIRVTLNIGISCYPLDTSDVNDLIKNADVAMMQARVKGCNRIQFYNDQIGNLTYDRQKIEIKLKKAVFDKEFQLYYQPQVYCNNGTLCGFETLIRWYQGDGQFISPLDFIPIAEEVGMIVPLGYWIMENAAKQLADWKSQTGKSIRISVNVSTKQLVEMDFIQRLQDTLTQYNIPPELFEIEITESYQIENSINILDTLNRIERLGVSIAIDDFGTGYSSLYYIKNIPAQRIKIAKELIDNIESDVYSNSILQMVISIAKVKGIKVIAEGVETKEQWECLKELGCDEIQGFFFARPMPAGEIETKWLNINNFCK